MVIQHCFKRHRGYAPVPAVVLTAAILLLLAGCDMVVGGGGRGSSSLHIVVNESAAVGAPSGEAPQPQLLPAAYRFTGSGPNEGSFSTITASGSVTIPDLTGGRWNVRVDALNEDEAVILTGESSVEVAPHEEVALAIELELLTGQGSLLVLASWNAEHTLAPLATVSITDADGRSTLHQLVLDPGSDGTQGYGSARVTVEDLPTGLYQATVQLYDGAHRVSGSAAAVRVLHGLEVWFGTEFPDINKVGLPVEITEESFSFAWDEPEAYTPSHYHLYHRLRGEREWVFLAEAPADVQPRFTVAHDLLPYGTYEFAVSSFRDGNESPLHTSMADDAQPGSGWYVRWIGPQ